MNKIKLIIAREYLTRVRKKSFIIMSIIGPLLTGLLIVVPIWLGSRESGDEKIIEVLDESGYFRGKFNDNGAVSYIYLDNDIDDAKEELRDKGNYGLLYIPALDLDNPNGITFFGESNPSIDVTSSLERFLKNEIEEIKLNQSGIDKEKLAKIKTWVKVDVINLTDKGEKEGDVGVAMAVGYVSAFLMYMFIFMYGIQTLRGVIEEKTSRIVEVIISSVKPFQLMMGKIIGIGAVGLTQGLIWMILSAIVYNVAISYYGIDLSQGDQVVVSSGAHASENVSELFNKIETINFPLILGMFLFYFLGAYLFYGSLFAAVGSAVDNDSDAQQFQLPVTLPLILSMVFLVAVLREPHGSIAFWASMVPFTSPVVMMMRIPFDPPMWHIALSMFFLIIGFIFTTWLAGRIYRIGILMHGAKVNYKVIAKWLMMKN